MTADAAFLAAFRAMVSCIAGFVFGLVDFRGLAAFDFGLVALAVPPERVALSAVF